MSSIGAFVNVNECVCVCVCVLARGLESAHEALEHLGARVVAVA